MVNPALKWTIAQLQMTLRYCAEKDTSLYFESAELHTILCPGEVFYVLLKRPYIRIP